MNKHYKEIVSLFLAIGIALVTFAQDPTSKEVDDLVQKTMTAFNVPGIAVGIIKDGKVIHSKGYGIRSINTKKPVDSNTSFAIASNSKAFTAFALGMLVDEGKLTWDSKVVDFIPEFSQFQDGGSYP